MRKSDCIHTGKCIGEKVRLGSRNRLDCTDCEDYAVETDNPDKPWKPTEQKICALCGKSKPLYTGFYLDKQNVDNHKTDCIECRLAAEKKRLATLRKDKPKPIKEEQPYKMTPQGKVPKPQETPTPKKETTRGWVELDKLTLAIRIVTRLAGRGTIPVEEAISRVYRELEAACQ